MKAMCMMGDGRGVEQDVSEVYEEAVSIARRKFRVKKSDIKWQRKLFGLGKGVWLTDPALYLLDHERKVLKVDAVNVGVGYNPFVDIARVEKVAKHVGWKLEWTD